MCTSFNVLYIFLLKICVYDMVKCVYIRFLLPFMGQPGIKEYSVAIIPVFNNLFTNKYIHIYKLCINIQFHHLLLYVALKLSQNQDLQIFISFLLVKILHKFHMCFESFRRHISLHVEEGSHIWIFEHFLRHFSRLFIEIVAS